VSVQETKRQTAERHVREAERHVSRQQEILEHLRDHGRSTELAERLLGNLQDLLAMHREHLARITANEL
jgi:hypothetical protein